jgi:protocatechuate 3,4-dioxygenase beta subunit
VCEVADEPAPLGLAAPPVGAGAPVRNAFVEIWQVDHEASYLHAGGRQEQFDANLQGYGRFLSDSTGRYYFRTIKPVPYTLNNTFRAPHVHMALSRGGRRILTTQLHVRGHADNERDPLLRQIRDPQDVETVLADFGPLPGSRMGERSATFDLVVGEHHAEHLSRGRAQRRAHADLPIPTGDRVRDDPEDPRPTRSSPRHRSRRRRAC